MKRKPVSDKTPLFSMVNISTRNELKELQMAEFIRQQKFDPNFSHQIFCFFTELPLRNILLFLKNHDLSKRALQLYYKKFILELERNLDLEEILTDE